MIHRNSFSEEVRAEFEASKRDNDKIRAFFRKYNHLSIADIAQALNIDRSHLFRLRKKCGLNETGEKRINKAKVFPPLDKPLPENWREKDTFLEFYYKYGPENIAKATGLKKKTIINLKSEFDAQPLIINECDNHQWCYRNYILGDRSQAECAKMAGVSVSTFHAWLLKHNIDRKKYANYAVPLYIKELAKNLIEQPIVRNVKFRNGYLRVNYYSRNNENYYYTVKNQYRYPKSYKIKPEDTEIKQDYEVQYVYDVGLQGENPYPMQFRLHKNFCNMTFMEQRLAFHSFLKVIVDRKWEALKHPDYILDDDFDRCKYIDIDKYWLADNSLRSHVNYGKAGAPGIRIAEHYFKHSFGSRVFCNRYVHQRYLFLKKLIKKNTDVSISTYMRFINRNDGDMTMKHFQARFKFYKDFGSTYAVLKKLGITGTMLDLSPGYGYNALAASLCGIKYLAVKDHRIHNTLNNGFSEFVGLKHGVYDGEQVDCLLYHNYYFPSEILLERYVKAAKRIIIFVPKPEHDYWVRTHKPNIVLKYEKRSVTRDHDFLMIW